MVLISLLIATGLQAGPATYAGDFAQYAPEPAYAGGHAPLRLRDARSRRYRSALENAADADVDFDGRYVLAEIGCGAGCLEVATIDAKTGAIAWLPGRVSGWPKDHPDPVECHVDSSLVRIYGQLGGTGSPGPHAFVFDGRRFTPVAAP